MEYWVVPAMILFGGLFVGLVSGLPMAFTLGGAAIVAGFIFQGFTIALYCDGQRAGKVRHCR